MAYKPTSEQAAITDAAATGRNLVIEAGAGAGKTSTLKMIAGQARKVQYIAYNRAIKDEAAASFPNNTRCTTAHGMAYGPVATQYLRAGRKVNGPIVPAMEVARILGIREPLRLTSDKAPLAPQQIARLAVQTVKKFCKSADEEVTRWHVPRVPGLTDTPLMRAALGEAILPFARRAWDDIVNKRGRLRFEHDHYLKIFSLSKPQLNVDLLLVDEAQDLNPAVKAIVDAQHCQVILVGDRCQAINGWNGAVDAMETFEGDRLYLSQSFRFGDAIADEANKWLTILDADLRLRGFDQVPSRVEELDRPDAILCRTNATALSNVITGLEDGRRVALVGGGDDIKALAEAARDLKNGRGTDHRELMAFNTWAEVVDYAEEDAGADNLKTLVRMVESYGAETLINTLRGLTGEQYADLIVSTSHKSKGREWDTVKVADDFKEPQATDKNPDPEIAREDAMLAYVTVTRAKRILDPEGLAWVDNWLPAPADAPATVDAPAAPAIEVIEVQPVERHTLSTSPFGEVCAEDGMPWPCAEAPADDPIGWDTELAFREELDQLTGADIQAMVDQATTPVEPAGDLDALFDITGPVAPRRRIVPPLHPNDPTLFDGDGALLLDEPPVTIEETGGIPDHLDQDTEVDHADADYWRAYCPPCDTSPCAEICEPPTPAAALEEPAEEPAAVDEPATAYPGADVDERMRHVKHCLRCGRNECWCDPTARRRWYELCLPGYPIPGSN